MVSEEIIERMAKELSLPAEKVKAAVELLNAGSTIPFIARYRKDATGQLDEVQLESISEANLFYIAMLQRRESILDTIKKQDKLTPELEKAISECWDRNHLEDLYLPFKKQRRTKATVAREQGLEPLADFIWHQVEGEKPIEEFAATFVDEAKGVSSVEAALEGARHILAEQVSLDAQTRTMVRTCMEDHCFLAAHSTKLSEGQKTKFSAYYDFKEPMKKLPSHRLLAILRGVKEGALRMEVILDEDDLLKKITEQYVKDANSSYAPHIVSSVEDSYKRLVRPSIENEVVGEARKNADDHAIKVFRDNAFNLLLASPAGRIPVIGLDPGLRTGCKLAVIDDMGNFKENATIFLQASADAIKAAEETLVGLLGKHSVLAIAIGNGTGSREAQNFVKELIAKTPSISKGFCVLVNEAGASIYSASKVAREEFPELDLTVRGAISIARRLQDPLAELVKIEPRSVGVGQYQHDVNQKTLREGLHRTVVSCVNQVGVDLNTASVPLLQYVSGVQLSTAQNIVKHRNELGGFKNREQLMDVDGIGPRVFEQCAGFLRIDSSENALDATAIHPEAYDVVEGIAAYLKTTPAELIGNREQLNTLEIEQFKTDTIGDIALKDIVSELLKPSRDPRKKFVVPEFLEGVEEVKDLKVGMDMQGVVTNVTDFGAFVDVGVHQDGLVHLSELANRFVRDPLEIVRVGDIVKVRVIDVDLELPRVSLSIKALLPQKKQKPRSKGASTSNKPSARGDSKKRSQAAKGGGKRPQKNTQNKKRSDHKKAKGRQQPQAPKPDRMNTQLSEQLLALKDKFNK